MNSHLDLIKLDERYYLYMIIIICNTIIKN